MSQPSAFKYESKTPTTVSRHRESGTSATGSSRPQQLWLFRPLQRPLEWRSWKGKNTTSVRHKFIIAYVFVMTSILLRVFDGVRVHEAWYRTRTPSVPDQRITQWYPTLTQPQRTLSKHLGCALPTAFLLRRASSNQAVRTYLPDLLWHSDFCEWEVIHT